MTIDGDLGRYGTTVHMASGMVCAQANCTFVEALAMIEALARETLRTTDEIAQAVLDRSVRFEEN